MKPKPKNSKDPIFTLNQFNPSKEDWSKIDTIISELGADKASGEVVQALLGVFERHPDEGYEGVWTTIHFLETVPDYATHVVASLQRQPSVLGVMLVGRMLNSDIEKVGTISLRKLLEKISAARDSHEAVREQIEATLHR